MWVLGVEADHRRRIRPGNGIKETEPVGEQPTRCKPPYLSQSEPANLMQD